MLDVIIFVKCNVVTNYLVRTCATLDVVVSGIMILNRAKDVHSAVVDSFVLRMEEVVVVVEKKKTLPTKGRA